MSLPDLQKDPAQRRGVRRYNVNQTLRSVVVFGMSVWTPYSLVGIHAPESWPQSAREAVMMPAMVFLAAWLVLGFHWRRRTDRWGSES